MVHLVLSTASSLRQIGHMLTIRNVDARFCSLGISTASSLRQIRHMLTIRNREALYGSPGIINCLFLTANRTHANNKKC